MSAPGRNEPCPCGSGRRYKDCHGSLSAAVAEPPLPAASLDPASQLRAAVERQRSGDLDGAESIAQAVLRHDPANVDALHLAGLCALESGRIDASLAMLLAGARAAIAAGQAKRRLWGDINLAFKRALSGVDSAFAADRRADYARWVDTPVEGRRDIPSVSVILLVTDGVRGLDRSLASIEAQTYRPAELIVADGLTDRAMAGAIFEPLARERGELRILSLPGAGEAELIDAAVRVATGEYVNALLAGNEFALTRLEGLVDAVARRGRAWGFSEVYFVDPSDRSVAIAALGSDDQPLAQIIAGADTIGASFIHRQYVGVDVGNLFFSRSLFERAGGMRKLALAYAWDFCLRAVWHEEPVYVPAALYRRHVGGAGDLTPSEAAVTEQYEIFRDYYRRACDETERAPNPFAPCVAHWRLHFYKAPIHVSHAGLISIDRLEALARAITEATKPAERSLRPGVDLIGFAFAEFGLGESLRGLAVACRDDGIPFAVRDADMRIHTRQIDRSIAPHVSREMSHRCALFCVNPDLLQPLLPLVQAAFAAGARVIGYWYWELDRLPREWSYALQCVDELWAPSAFVAEAMRRATSKPVVKIPPPVEVALSRVYTRAEFGLSEDRFLFLFNFDFNSYVNRKNPEGVIAAFKLAFGERRDVGLVIKSVNGSQQSERMRALRGVIDGDGRIVVKDGFMSRDEVYGLESVVDSFASLHRSEGFGLGLAESMALGKPVMGTAYSGNMEFMNAANSCLVDYELVAVGEGEYLYADSEFRWAEPDVDHAAYQMRRLVDDSAFRSRIADAGRHEIASHFNRAATARLLRARLAELGLIERPNED